MQKIQLLAASSLFALGALAAPLQAATPEEDRAAFQKYFYERFPEVPKDDFVNGAYAIDKVGRENWEAIEEFPPYEPFIDSGKEMWETPFANGKGYKDCFPDGPAIAQNYPRWDKKQGMVITLPLAINQCREANGEKPLKSKKGPINDLLSYIAFDSRDKAPNAVIPKDYPRALAA